VHRASSWLARDVEGVHRCRLRLARPLAYGNRDLRDEGDEYRDDEGQLVAELRIVSKAVIAAVASWHPPESQHEKLRVRLPCRRRRARKVPSGQPRVRKVPFLCAGSPEGYLPNRQGKPTGESTAGMVSWMTLTPVDLP
jgi:hypothetical protein